MRLTLVKKALLLLNAACDETESILYPYKGVNKDAWKKAGSFSKTLYYLKKKGYLEEVEIKGKQGLKLTLKGRIKILGEIVRGNKPWDGQWRILIFDIPEESRRQRDFLRDKLVDIGFKMLQRSVWVSPYDYSEYIEDIVSYLKVRGSVYYFIARAIDDESDLMRKFDLFEKDRPV